MNAAIKVPYVDISAQHTPIKDELLAAMSRVIDHGQFILGDEVTEFEEKFSTLCEASYAVGVNSGTDALVFALKALGIGPGDEVITPPNSFVASASCIALVGATPVFADVLESYNMSPVCLEKAITPKTKAVLPVHLTGRPADMDRIMEVAKRYNLYVIEDCAQAVGAEYKGQKVGSLGDIGCFSLHPLKTLNACGDGGVITTNDSGIRQVLTTLRNIGLETRDNCVAWSNNSRLDTLQAAILLVKLKYLEKWTDARRANALVYQERLSGIREFQVPKDQKYERAVYHTFVALADRRDGLQQHLSNKGIGTAIHYPVPIHLQDVAQSLGHKSGSFPVAEAQADRIISLPIYPEMDQQQLIYVADCVRSFYE